MHLHQVVLNVKLQVLQCKWHLHLVTVKSDNYMMRIDEFGRISQVELLETKYHDEEGNNLKMLNVNKVKPLEVRFSDVKLNEEAFKTPYVNTGSNTIDLNNGAQTVTLTQTLSSVTLTKKDHLQTYRRVQCNCSNFCIYTILHYSWT